MYVTGLDGGVWSTSRNAEADTWSAWSSLGGQTFSAPAVAREPRPAGGAWVFVRGTDNALWGRIDNQWRYLGGLLIDTPAATAHGTGVDVVVRGGDNALWSRLYRPSEDVAYRESAWSDWSRGWAPKDPSLVYCHNSTPSNAAGYQAAFDGLRTANTAGWIANDGGIPVTLADGRTIWLFGDTLTGSPPTIGDFANNGFVVQEGPCFRPVTEPIPDPAPDQFVWPTGAVQEGNTLLVVGFHMRRGGVPPFDFELVNIAVALFSLPALTLQSVTDLPLPISPSYGENLLVEGQHVYVYGQTREPVPNNFPTPRHYVARAPLGGVLDASAWRFWQNVPAGQDPWSSNVAQDADPMLFDNSETGGPLAGFSVGFNGSYVGSAFPIDVFETDSIRTWSGAGPGGPWTRRPVPAVTGVNTWYGQLAFPTRFAYGGRIIFNVAGSPIAQWSTNHESMSAILADGNYYKVWFATPLPGSIP